MSIAWRADLSIGIDTIDIQHKELITRAGNLFEACKQGEGYNKIKEMIVFLETYMFSHFEEEEDLQIKYNYSKYESHKQQHNLLIDRLKQLKEEFDLNQSPDFLLLNLNRLIIDWIVHHISISDKLFGNFLKTNGLVEDAS